MSLKIAIEGKSGVGTTTIGLELAKKLNCPFVSFGMMYRSLACMCDENDINIDDEKQVLELFEDLTIDLFYGESARINFKGELISEKDNIQSQEIAKIASILSSKKIIRDRFTEIQQGTINENDRIVVEGRALSKFFSGLDRSFYLYANPEIRAERRSDQLIENGEEVDRQEILNEVRRRDWEDRKSDLGSDSKNLVQVDVSYWDIEKTVTSISNFIESEELKKESKECRLPRIPSR